MNKILCFDVANGICAVAVAIGQEILAFEQEQKSFVQAEELIVVIERALNKSKMQYRDIDYLAVTVGPGSFTGIRIGLATAHGIIYASKIKGVAISNFETVFYRLKMQVQKFDSAVIMINAYRQQLYVQQFDQEHAVSGPMLINISGILDYLDNIPGQIVCAGSGLKEVYHQIKGTSNLTILPRFPVIRAIHIARYADEKIKKNKIDPLLPLYIRPPDATPPD